MYYMYKVEHEFRNFGNNILYSIAQGLDIVLWSNCERILYTALVQCVHRVFELLDIFFLSIFKDNCMENVDRFCWRKKKNIIHKNVPYDIVAKSSGQQTHAFFILSPGLLYGPYNHSKRDNLALCWIDSLPPYDNYRVRTLSKVY